MLIVNLFVISAVFLLVLFVVTQVLLPFLNGEPMFPSFKKSEVKAEIDRAENVLEKVAEAKHLKKVVNEVNRQKAELEKK